MKIWQLNSINFNNKTFRQNQSEGLKCPTRYPNLSTLTPLKQDTVSFSAKIPSIVAPTMQDLINKTGATDVLRFNILRLAKYDVPCPVCGQIMLDPEKFGAFEDKIAETINPKEILDSIGEFKKYLHPIEAKIYSYLREHNAISPDKSLHGLLKSLLPKSEAKIMQLQTRIFTNIGILSRKLPKNEYTEVQQLLTETFARIFDPRETSRFSRKVYIDKLKHIFIPQSQIDEMTQKFANEFCEQPTAWKIQKNEFILEQNKFVEYKLRQAIASWEFTPEQNSIIKEAEGLPMAYNNVDAFIVKYAKRDYKGANPDHKIASRLLSNSVATIEHIVPLSNKGLTEPKNLALECAGDNNNRNSLSILEQIIENPNMPKNYRRYMKRLCELHLNNLVEKSYITQHNRTYKEESCGILNANLSSLRRQERQMREEIGGTPTKAERRAAKKVKRKEQRQKIYPQKKQETHRKYPNYKK